MLKQAFRTIKTYLSFSRITPLDSYKKYVSVSEIFIQEVYKQNYFALHTHVTVFSTVQLILYT